MTRKASHPSRAAKLGIGVSHELNHLSSGLLSRLVVLLELIFDVAVSAIHPERRFEREHDLQQSLGGNSPEQLNVFVLLFGAFFFAACRQRIKRRKRI